MDGLRARPGSATQSPESPLCRNLRGERGGPASPSRPPPSPSSSASFKSYRNWPLSDSDCGQIAVRFGTRCFFAASAHKGPAVVCGQGSIFRTPGESSRSPSTNRDNFLVCLRHLTQSYVSYLARSPRGVLRSMGSGHQGHGVGPGQHLLNFAESSRSPCTYQSQKWNAGGISHSHMCHTWRGVLAES